MEKSIRFIIKFVFICMIGLAIQAFFEGAVSNFSQIVINYDYKYIVTWTLCILYQTMVLGIAFILANRDWD